MKNIRKALLAMPVIAATAAVLSGCTLKEELDLAGYPPTELGLKISDISVPAPETTLTAVYDNEGKLVLDGALTHEYTLTIGSVSSTDLTVTLEPILVNVPVEKVTISPSTIEIPAGSGDVQFTVTFNDPDFNFAAPDRDAKTYEFGAMIADVRGGASELIGSEAKVIIEKELYSGHLSVADQQGRTASFTRAYWDGTIANEEPISYTFNVYLDRPANEDITVDFTMDGLGAAFADDWSIVPSPVVIPAGSVVSDSITWTLTDDFLMTDDQADTVSLSLIADLETADPYISMAGGGADSIRFTIFKSLEAIQMIQPPVVPTDWTKYSPVGWVTSHPAMFDGNTGQYNSTTASMAITVDMLEVKRLSGIVIRPPYYYYNVSEVEIFISEDGTTWRSIGKKGANPLPNFYAFEVIAPLSSRYLKFGINQTYRYIAEIEIYGE